MHFMSHGRGEAASGDSPVHPLNSPTFGHGVGVRKLSHEIVGSWWPPDPPHIYLALFCVHV
jgi:hypothetical protein